MAKKNTSKFIRVPLTDEEQTGKLQEYDSPISDDDAGLASGGMTAITRL